MTMTSDELATAAADHLWLHFWPLSGEGDAPLTVIERGEGAYVWDDQGNRYIDGLAGLFVVQAGHGRQEIADAAEPPGRQARLLPAVDLRPPDRHRAGRPARRPGAGRPQPRVLHHRRRRGGGVGVEAGPPVLRHHRPARAREGDQPADRVPRHHARRPEHHRARRHQGAVPARCSTVRRATCRTRRWRSAPTPTTRYAGADAIEAMIIAEGPETVAAVFLEPVQNAGGCLVPPPGYFQRVREICDRHGVLLVSDEVICAFGRLGDLVRRRRASGTSPT